MVFALHIPGDGKVVAFLLGRRTAGLRTLAWAGVGKQACWGRIFSGMDGWCLCSSRSFFLAIFTDFHHW